MKRMLWIAALLMSAGVSGAKPLTWIGAQAGVMGANHELKSGMTGGLQAGVTGKHVGTSLSFLYYSGSSKGGADRMLSEGGFQMTPVMLNVFGRLPIEGVAALRLGGGVSYVHASHELESSLVQALQSMGFGAKEEVDSGLGYQIMGGIDFWLSDRVSVGAEIIYLFFEPRVKATVWSLASGRSASAEADVKLDRIIGLAGIKYHLK